MIPYGRQHITQADIDAVVAVLRSDFLTQGPMVPRFEAAVATYCGVPHAVAANSATSSLHLACLALGLGPGDWLWTSPITFVASANCARYCGASVDFVDVDPETGNLDPAALARKLVDAERAGRLPRVIVPVHLAGESCDMDEIGALARRFGVRVIEDASHAIGGRFGDRTIGACEHSDITVFSFHPVKLITTAEGGMATTSDPALAERMALLRSHGITRDRARMQQAPEGDWVYEQQTLGFNYRMTDVQAALGVSQLDRLDEYVDRRHALADRYEALLAGFPLDLPPRRPGRRSALHLYAIRIRDGAPDRATVFQRMRAAGVGVNVHYIPVHLQPYYRGLGFGPGDFPAAEAYYRRILTLPLFPALEDSSQEEVVAALGEALRS